MSYRYNRIQDKRIKKVERKVHKMQRQMEIKYIDNFVDEQTVSTTGTLTLLNGIGVGDNQVQREGANITMTSLLMRMKIFIAPTNIVAASYRVIVFIDKQANGAAPTLANNPLTGNNPALLNNAVISQLIYSMHQKESLPRFRVLMDKVYTIPLSVNNQVLPATSGTTSTITANTVGNAIFIRKRFRLGLVVQFGDDVNTIAGINKNSLYCAVVGDSASSGVYDLATRVYFRDN